MAWLEANRMMVIGDYHAAFVAAFGREDVTASNLRGLRKRMRWLVGREPGRYVGRNRKYGDAEIAWLRDHCTLEIHDLHEKFVAAFPEHSGMSVAGVVSLRKRHGLKTGRTGRFEKGSVPWSKGKKLPFNANSAATQFKKGETPHNYRGPGHESVDEAGYVWIVIDRPNPYTGASTWRVQKHRFLWEQKHGPVPEGHVLKCLDGDRSNTDPSNWEAIPMALIPRLAGKSGRDYDHAPAELKPVIMTVAKLEHRARKSRRKR